MSACTWIVPSTGGRGCLGVKAGFGRLGLGAGFGSLIPRADLAAKKSRRHYGKGFDAGPPQVGAGTLGFGGFSGSRPAFLPWFCRQTSL